MYSVYAFTLCSDQLGVVFVAFQTPLSNREVIEL